MGMFKHRREAESAAHILKRSPQPKCTKAIQHLGEFAAKEGLFFFNDDEDDWDDYQRRCKAERAEDDDINTESVVQGLTPAELLLRRHMDRIEKTSEQFAQTICMRIKPAEIVSDPNSVDYADPIDFDRTPIIKATIDNDIVMVRDLVERQKASLYVRDSEGNNALVNAINFGHMEIAVYLKAQMAERPQQCRLVMNA